METRPKTMKEYPGQEEAKKLLIPALEATKMHGKQFPHVLFPGPAGIGKTTFAYVLSAELGTKMVEVASRQIKTAMDFIKVATTLRDNDILFLEEIHGLDKNIEEEIYKAIDDFGYWHKIDNKPLWIPLNHFILVGATTRIGSMSAPLVSRFGIVAKLQYYSIAELTIMTIRQGAKLGILFEEDAAELVAKMSRGIARKMTKLVDFIHTLSLNKNLTIIDIDFVYEACNTMGIDKNGLNRDDIAFMKTILVNFNNKPTGLASLAASLGDSVENLEQEVEPYLVRSGFVIRTTRGRMLSDLGQRMVA